jgi:hypothetical protein
MTTSSLSLKITKIAELDAQVTGLGNVWRELKKRIDTSCRCPRSLGLREEPRPMHLNDGEQGARFALDLGTMRLSDEQLSISSGEWACHAGTNHDQAIDGVPNATALVELVWHDYYRYCFMTLQVPPGALRRQFQPPQAA